MSAPRHRRPLLWFGLAVVAASAATVACLGRVGSSTSCVRPDDASTGPEPRDPPAIAVASDSVPPVEREANAAPTVATASPARDSTRLTAMLEGVVVDAAARPVAGARVRARLAQDLGELSAGRDAGALPVAEATSSDDGTFRLSGEAGRWRIDAEAEGKALVTAPIVTTGVPAAVVTLVLVDGARLRGRVSGPDGEARALARVRAVEERPDAEGDPTQAVRAFTTSTDSDGRYSLDRLPPHRRWRMSAGMPSGAWLESSVSLRVDAEAVWNATLPAGVSVSGRVVARSDDAPVADAHVWIEVVPDGDVAASPMTAVGEATTDRDGRFRVDDLPTGRVALAHVGAAGFAPWLRLARDADAEIPRVEAAGATYPTIRLERGGRVFGHVNGLDGRPRPGVRVSLVDEATAAVGARSTVATADGTYRFDGVASDRAFALVAVEDGESPPTCRLEQRIEDGDELEHDVLVAPRRDVALRGGASVTGQVIDADDRPIDRALLVVGVGAPPSGVDALLARAVSKTRTAADGTFRFDALPDTLDMYVCVVAARAYDAFAEGSPTATAYAVRADDRVTLRLGRSNSEGLRR